MHEFSTVSQIVKTVLEEVEKRKAKEVKEVTLQIGKFTYLGIDQLKFSYEVLVEGTILEKSKLIIEEKSGVVECSSCGLRGPIPYVDDPDYHQQIPVFTCPKCNSAVRIVEGKDCLIKSVKMVV